MAAQAHHAGAVCLGCRHTGHHLTGLTGPVSAAPLLLSGRNPQRYAGDMPSYARLVNFTERLWDYGSCVEAQLKIWLARHLIASENSGKA